MPIEYHYDSEKNILYETGTGDIPLQEFLEYREILKGMPLQSGLRALADYSQAVVTVSLEEMRQASAGYHHAIRGMKNVKLAIYANSELGYGMARMFSSIATKENFSVQVFSDLEAARSWLGLNVEK